MATTTLVLVNPDDGWPNSVAYSRCQTCMAPVSEPRVCASCRCVCYCSQQCAQDDADHVKFCSNYGQHMTTDVNVTLPGDPFWLRATMHPRADLPWCDLLKSARLHDETYSLLCGCVQPSSPHRFVPNPTMPARLPRIEDSRGYIPFRPQSPDCT